MNIDFLHNQIIRDTISPRFIESFNENLVPYLISEYGSSLEEIQFYEDHLASGLRINGEFFYPLTLVCDGRSFTRFIKWQVSNYRNYDRFNPYTYKGAELLEFNLLDDDDVPAEVKAVVAGKPIYADDRAIPVVLSSASEDKTFLAGKYSQGFVDTLAHSITEKIEEEFSISGLSESGVIIEIRFEPGTFMEHIVGNVTYRRLLIKARGCSARDLWVKWTRLDGNGIYTVSDNVLSDDILFELAEDVPGKIREKEYRSLTANSVDKYQSAMGRKNITAWRDVMRRVIKRGEVEKNESRKAAPLTVTEEVEEIVSAAPIFTPETEEVKVPALDLASADEALDALFADLDEEDKPNTNDEDDDLSALLRSAIAITASDTAEQVDYEEELEDEKIVESELDEEEPEEAEEHEEIEEPIKVISSVKSEEAIRAELERKIRAELEAEIERKHKEAEELRARLDAQLRAEAREKELLAEAARAAIIEQQRYEKERREEERRAREEAARREDELRRIAEKERSERIRAEEEARIRAEMHAREKEQAAAAKAAKEAAEAAEKAKEGEAKYVSKVVKLFFKYTVDAAVTKRIHEIILATIKYYHKEDVYIKIKAVVPDSSTVHLEFVKIPENEIPLLVNIIKVLGRSDLGITKATLD